MRKVSTLVLILAVLGALLLAAPAPSGAAPKPPPVQGGGDSEPIGPWPHVICHVPSSVPTTADYVYVWSHVHNVSSFETYVSATYRGGEPLECCTVDQTYTELSSGHWDVRIEVSIYGLGLNSSDVIAWTVYCDSYDDWTTYYAYGTTNVD
jgi:hypothetical protein